MEGEQDGWTERRERGTKGRQQNARMRRWRIIKREREREPHHVNHQHQGQLHHGLERSTARRLTEERVEGRKNGRNKVKAMNGGSNRAHHQRVGTTDRWTRDVCERHKGGEIERDG